MVCWFIKEEEFLVPVLMLEQGKPAVFLHQKVAGWVDPEK